MMHAGRSLILATCTLAALGGCATRYGTAVGAFGQIQVASASVADVRIVRHVDLLKAYPGLPDKIPADDAGLVPLLRDAPSGRPNQGPYLYREGRYFLSYRCGDMQRFLPMDVRSTSERKFEVSCA